MTNEQKVKIKKFYQNSSRPSNYLPNALVVSPPEYPPLMSGLMQINPDTKEIWISAGRELVSDWINITAGGGGGGVSSIDVNGGTGISVTPAGPITSSGAFTVTNTAPDQVVSLAAGLGIGVSGTYPSFTISADAYDSAEGIIKNTALANPTFELGRTALAATADFSVDRYINAGTKRLSISGNGSSSILGANPILELNNTYTGADNSQVLKLTYTGSTSTVSGAALYIRAGVSSNSVVGIDLQTVTNQASISCSQTGNGNSINASASSNISGVFSSGGGASIPAIMAWKSNGSNSLIDNALQINKSTTAAAPGSGACIFYTLKTIAAATPSQTRTVGRIAYQFENSSTEGSYSAKYSVSVVNNTVETTRLEMYGADIIKLTQGLSEYADDAAAAVGGIPITGLYRTGSFIKIRVS